MDIFVKWCQNLHVPFFKEQLLVGIPIVVSEFAKVVSEFARATLQRTAMILPLVHQREFARATLQRTAACRDPYIVVSEFVKVVSEFARAILKYQQ